MTYGDMRDYILQLINQYSMTGSKVPITYNDQADALARIPALVRDALAYVTTTTRRLRAVAELAGPRQLGGLWVYDLPGDFFQAAGGLWRREGSEVRRVHGYRFLGSRQVAVTKGGEYLLEYFRYPVIPRGTPGDHEPLDCPEEAAAAVALYAAAHLVMDDNAYLYAALYAEFERRLQRLSEGVGAEWGRVVNDYGD